MLLSTDCLHPHACGQHEGNPCSRWPTFGVQPLQLAFSEQMSFCFVSTCCRVADEDAPALFCRVWQVGLLCNPARASYTRWCNRRKSTSRNHSQICTTQLREQGTRLAPSLADEDVRPREGFARLWKADVLDQTSKCLQIDLQVDPHVSDIGICSLPVSPASSRHRPPYRPEAMRRTRLKTTDIVLGR